MPRPRNPLPEPKPGFIYKGPISNYIVLKVDSKEKSLKVYATSSGRCSSLKIESFLTNYDLKSCQEP